MECQLQLILMPAWHGSRTAKPQEYAGSAKYNQVECQLQLIPMPVWHDGTAKSQESASSDQYS